jgi:hypothetical protein
MPTQIPTSPEPIFSSTPNMVEGMAGGDSGTQSDVASSPSSKKKEAGRKRIIPTSRARTSRRPRGHQKSAEELALEDAEAEDREHDPTQTTMSALVDDLPVGRVMSSRMAVKQRMRESRARERERRELLRRHDRDVTMGKPKDREPSRDVDPNLGVAGDSDASAGDDGGGLDGNDVFAFAKVPDNENEQDRDEDEEEGGDWLTRLNIKASNFTTQISVDEQGNFAADELALEAPEVQYEPENYTAVYERDGDRFVNSQTHSRRHKGTARWSMAETAEFFHVRNSMDSHSILVRHVLISLLVSSLELFNVRNGFRIHCPCHAWSDTK